MNFIAELLKLSKKHAQSINIALLAVLASGSIAGGIWIRNLYTIIEEKNKTIAQLQQLEEIREQLEQQRLATATAAAKTSIDKLTQQVDELTRDVTKTKNYIGRLGTIITRHTDVDASVASTLTTVSSGDGVIAQALVAAQGEKLKGEIARVRSDISEAAEWIDYVSLQVVAKKGEPTSGPPPGLPTIAFESRSNTAFVWFALLAGIAILVWVWRRARRTVT